MQYESAGGRRHPREVHLRFSARLHRSVVTFAEEGDLGINGAVRVLVQRGLELEPDSIRDQGDLQSELKTIGQSVLAALIAAEHARLMVARMWPAGSETSAQLAEDAATAARQRLLLVEQTAEAEA